MWAMQSGMRVFTDNEWNLFAAGLRSVHAWVEMRLRHRDMDPISRDLPPFDTLTPEQQLMILADVAGALRWKKAPAPDHTAAREAAVAAIFDEVRDCLLSELDGIPFEDGDALYVRRLILAAAAETEQEEPLPSPECEEPHRWEAMIDEIKDRVFWDEDYLIGDHFLDLPPEDAEAWYLRLGIAPDYFIWTPDEPKPDEMRLARRKLEELLSDTPSPAKR